MKTITEKGICAMCSICHREVNKLIRGKTGEGICHACYNGLRDETLLRVKVTTRDGIFDLKNKLGLKNINATLKYLLNKCGEQDGKDKT